MEAHGAVSNFNGTKLEIRNYLVARVPLIVVDSSERERVERILRELAEENDAVKSNELFDLAERKGISKRTMENAKKEMGIQAKKINNAWYWELKNLS